MKKVYISSILLKNGYIDKDGFKKLESFDAKHVFNIRSDKENLINYKQLWDKLQKIYPDLANYYISKII